MVENVEFFDPEMGRLEKAMEIAARRQEVISQNIANAKTPGYAPMMFDEMLMKAVRKENQPKVQLEEEFAALTDNSIKYSTYVKLLSSKMNILKTIATQGRR